MSKIQSPLLGYNNNVRHKNRVFHIQTEDSGIKHPHVITHLFMDGGRILKSVKRSYGEHVGSDNLADTVRQMMKEQHKAMFIALRDGEYDSLLDMPPSGPAAAAAAVIAIEEAGPRVEVGPETARDRPSSPEDAPPSSRNFAPVAPAPAPPVAIAIGAPVAIGGISAPRSAEEPKPGLVASIPSAVPAHALAATRRAAEAAAPRNVVAPAPALGSQKAATPAAPPAAAPADRKPAAAASPNGTTPARQEPAPTRSRRYAPARPAAIFGQTQTPSGSIFGEDLVGDKTLDEVILSYLVDDLSPPKKK